MNVRSDRGSASAVTPLAMVFLMVVFVTALNAAMVLYGRGVVRGALDEGVRAAAVHDATGEVCAQRVGELVERLEPLGEVTFSCAAEAETVTATAHASFYGWLPGIDPPVFDMSAEAVRFDHSGG